MRPMIEPTPYAMFSTSISDRAILRQFRPCGKRRTSTTNARTFHQIRITNEVDKREPRIKQEGPP
jgi:hypothetical protein